MENTFKQAQFNMTDATATVLSSKKGACTCKYKRLAQIKSQKDMSHNRTKTYILKEGEKVTTLFPLWEEGKYLNLITKAGIIKKTPIEEFDNIRKGGLIALGLREGDELIGVMLSTGDDEFLVGTRRGKCIRFHEDDVRAMGRTATGVRSILLDEGDEVVDVNRILCGATVLSITERGMGKRTPEEDYRTQTRGGKGIIAMALTEKTGDLVCMKAVGASDIEEDVMIISSEGTIIRLPVEQISEISRNTQGVRLMRTEDRVASVAIVPHVEPDGE